MSSQTLPEARASDKPVEIAPSPLSTNEPHLARIVGLTGILLVALGLSVIFMNEVMGPRLLTKPWGFIAIAIGMVGLLMHALRDGDYQIRRAYNALGYGLIILAAILPVPNESNFLKYGWPCALLGLCFLLAFRRHETDPAWRRRVLRTIGAIGAATAIGGFLGGIVQPGFLLTYGLVLCILGLAYMCAFISQCDPASDAGYRAGVALGGLAVFAIVYAVLRSTVPSLVRTNVEPFLAPTGLLLIFLGAIYGAVALGVISDNRLVVLTRRELTSYFYSPMAYLVMLGMALIGFLAYWFFISQLQLGYIRYEPIVFHYFNYFPPILVVFVVPAVTMRLLAEEKRSGTYEVLMCAPVKETTVVLSKFLAGLAFFMILWGIWGLYLIALRVETGKEFDFRPVISFYIALLFSGAGFIGMGLFFSSLTKSQIVGAMLCFVGMLTLIVISMIHGSPDVGPVWQAVFRHLAFRELWAESLQGRVHVRDMILQGSFSIFWLFLTVKVLEARRWS
jgi:ABC-2 type transport system permease protein